MRWRKLSRPPPPPGPPGPRVHHFLLSRVLCEFARSPALVSVHANRSSKLPRDISGGLPAGRPSPAPAIVWATDRSPVGFDSAAVSWIEFANQRSQFKVRRIEPDGNRSVATIAGAGEGRPAGNPRMSRGPRELLFAWTETNAGALASSHSTRGY